MLQLYTLFLEAASSFLKNTPPIHMVGLKPSFQKAMVWKEFCILNIFPSKIEAVWFHFVSFVYNSQCFTMNIKKLTIWLKYTLHAISINKCPWSHGSWVCRWNSTTLSILEKNKQVSFCCCCCCCFKLRCQAPWSLYGPGTLYATQTVCIPGPVAFAFKVPRFRWVLLLLAEAICKPEWHVNTYCPVDFPLQLC